MRYVERNAKRAGLVKKAEEWPWSSVHVRLYGKAEQKKMLSPWPTPEPPDYVLWLNRSQGREEVEKIRCAIQRNRPYGSDEWVSNAIAKFGLKITMRSPGRPKKGS